MNNERQHWYQAFTLIDITNTGVTKFQPSAVKQRNQQRNWESVLQILGLRTQTFELSQEIYTDFVKSYEFGKLYKGKQKIWTFKFYIEHEHVYLANNNPVGVLEKDFEQTPIIVGLDETVKPPISLFYTSGPEKNIYFKIIQLEVNIRVIDA